MNPGRLLEKNKSIEDTTPDYEDYDSELHIPHTNTGISRRSDQLRFAALHCVIILTDMRN